MNRHEPKRNAGDAPLNCDSPLKWVCVAEAARVLSVSEKTVWRRAKAGVLTARKVTSERGGFVWEIALDPTGQTDRTSDRPTGQNGAVSFDLRSKPTGQATDRPDKTDRTNEAPTGQNGDLTTRYLARLESENDFLRRALEAAQQSEAVTKAALREALKIAPRQLAAPDGASDVAPLVSLASSGALSTSGAKEPERNALTAPAGNGLSSYGEIADWLERELNK